MKSWATWVWQPGSPKLINLPLEGGFPAGGELYRGGIAEGQLDERQR
jgi:hypothetical protein